MKIIPLVITGPTATGKSALALDLASALGGEIINADSLQLYGGLPLLTAKPSLQDLERIPHHLYGEFEGENPCSMAEWYFKATDILKNCLSRGKTPLIVGGTGLYINALLKGFSPIPPIPSPIRFQARQLYHQLGSEAFYQRLKEEDPLSADSLHPQDQQRCLRAWEVLKATGKSLKVWQLSPPHEEGIQALNPLIISVLPPRPENEADAAERFRAMISAGAIEEVALFNQTNPIPDHPLFKAIGYRDLSAYLASHIPLEEALRLSHIATRQYIKRQGTWFKHQLTPSILFKTSYKGDHKESMHQKSLEALLEKSS